MIQENQKIVIIFQWPQHGHFFPLSPNSIQSANYTTHGITPPTYACVCVRACVYRSFKWKKREKGPVFCVCIERSIKRICKHKHIIA